MPTSIIQDLVSMAPSGKVPIIRSPQTTTYKMQVISSSMIWAMFTILAPYFFPKHSFAIETYESLTRIWRPVWTSNS